MLLRRLIVILSLVYFLAEAYDVADSSLYQDGKEQYELMASYSKLPKYGDCWRNAIENVKTGCKGLNDKIQTNLAIMFTYCLLKHLKYDLVECEAIDLDNDEDENANLACYEKLKTNQNSFTTFTEFFTHTQNICFFLQNQVWNEKTLELVKESRKTQINLLQSVNKAVETQQKLIETNSYLQEMINNSASNVQNVLDEFNQQTKTQQMAIFHLFDRLQQIQSYILGEFTLFYSVIFYLFTIIVAYVLTSTRRTQSARAGSFILLTSMLLTESLIVSISKQNNELDTKFDILGLNFDLNYNLYAYIWLCRKFYIYLSFLHLVISAYMYCDYNHSNNKLLIEIKNDHNELKSLINEMKMNNSSAALLPVFGNAVATRPLLKTTAVLTAESIRRSCLGDISRRSYSVNNDDDDCNSSGISSTISRSFSTSTLCLTNSSADNTFVPSELSDDDDATLSGFEDESFDIESTYENSLATLNNNSETLNKSTASSIFTVFTRNSMLNDSKNPQIIINSYNLRPRKVGNYANLSTSNLEETRDFIKSIKSNNNNNNSSFQSFKQ